MDRLQGPVNAYVFSLTFAGGLPPAGPQQSAGPQQGPQQPAHLWNARSDPKAIANRERDIRRLHKWRRMLGAHSCASALTKTDIEIGITL